MISFCQTHWSDILRGSSNVFYKHTVSVQYLRAVTIKSTVFWVVMSFSLVESEVIKAVVMNSFLFWDTTLRSLLKVNQRFRRTCRLHLQSQIISQARNQCEAGSKERLVGVYWSFEGKYCIHLHGRRVSKELCILLILWPWKLGQYADLKCW
jgi:hypothetical protein